jgi:hypothetical protein
VDGCLDGQIGRWANGWVDERWVNVWMDGHSESLLTFLSSCLYDWDSCKAASFLFQSLKLSFSFYLHQHQNASHSASWVRAYFLSKPPTEQVCSSYEKVSCLIISDVSQGILNKEISSTFICWHNGKHEIFNSILMGNRWERHWLLRPLLLFPLSTNSHN